MLRAATAVVDVPLEVRARFSRSPVTEDAVQDRKSTRLNSSHLVISYAVFCLKKKQPRALWEPTIIPVSPTFLSVHLLLHGINPPLQALTIRPSNYPDLHIALAVSYTRADEL